MIRAIVVPLFFLHLVCHGQMSEKLILKGNYSGADSASVIEAFSVAKQAVTLMKARMDSIWNVIPQAEQSKKQLRVKRWMKEEAFTIWLGQPEKIRLARRRINQIHSKFRKNITLEIAKKNKGRCTGWISAWTIPFGKVRIRLCEDFFIYRTHLQEKVLIHELGHEAGILFHRRIHGCRSAKRAASSRNNIVKRSTENYAWLAMTYLGLECYH